MEYGAYQCKFEGGLENKLVRTTLMNVALVEKAVCAFTSRHKGLGVLFTLHSPGKDNIVLVEHDESGLFTGGVGPLEGHLGELAILPA